MTTDANLSVADRLTQVSARLEQSPGPWPNILITVPDRFPMPEVAGQTVRAQSHPINPMPTCFL